MSQINLETVRNLASAAQSEVFPRADDDAAFQEILARVRTATSLQEKLAIAGFTLDPIEHEGIDQSCETCMYFLVRRQWCDLPELDVPVDPQWSCRLWRI